MRLKKIFGVPISSVDRAGVEGPVLAAAASGLSPSVGRCAAFGPPLHLMLETVLALEIYNNLKPYINAE